MTKEERVEMYREFLAEEGYVPKIHGDGDVVFKYEGGLFFISTDEDDEELFRLVVPNFWAIESEAEREKAAKAALEATKRTKVAKVYLTKDDTEAVIEMFCSPPEAFKAVFGRSLSALRACVKIFREEMQR